MKKMIVLFGLIPFMTMGQDAPWGISVMQYGAKVSSYKADASENGNFNLSNHSIGATGRLQCSFLDFFAYGDQKFRIVDVIGFESGLGYQKTKTYRNDTEYNGEFITKKMWYDVGVDIGILAKFRVHPKVDVGVKYMYLSQVNPTFNYVGSHSAYGNAMNWAFSTRYDKFYCDLSLVKGMDTYPTPLSILDLKYRFKESGSWASFVGFQIGRGVYEQVNYGTDFISTYSRNWVQVSIGKMTNF